MHLTNYSVNKYNVDYDIGGSDVNGEKTGSKRSLKYLFEYLRTQNQDATTLWKDIQVKMKYFQVEKHFYFYFKRILLSKQFFLLNRIYSLLIECVDPVHHHQVKVSVLNYLVLIY
jgi:hypothetical protein